MLRALLVVAVMATGCGAPECTSSTPEAAICEVSNSPSYPNKPPQTTGTRLWKCVGGSESYILCANGCTASGSSRDSCN